MRVTAADAGVAEGVDRMVPLGSEMDIADEGRFRYCLVRQSGRVAVNERRGVGASCTSDCVLWCVLQLLCEGIQDGVDRVKRV
jgi:hypothetical protein